MAKKKKRRQKHRVPQTQPLEELLRAGKAELYGQVCWSIANRGTDRPRAGEVITLGSASGEGHHSTEGFRLTRNSIGNIELCMDLWGGSGLVCGEHGGATPR